MTLFEFIRQELSQDGSHLVLDDHDLSVIVDAIIPYQFMQEDYPG